MDDISSVFDDLEIERASLFGLSISANVCALFAASYPERVEHLILAHPFPRGIRSEEYPWGLSEDRWLDWLRQVREHWGDRDFMENYARSVAPNVAADPEELDLFVWQLRLSLGPTSAVDWNRIGMETDIVDVLSSIRVPTLVLSRPDDHATPGDTAGAARFVADRIRDAHQVTLLSDDSSAFSRESADTILEFLRGEAPVAVPDTVLATVLFTDLVSSSELAAAIGDRAWRDLVTRHHADVRRELGRYRGREVDSAGDGFFCRFDGPARAMACARAIVDGAREYELEVRAGIHTGECQLVGEKLAGIAGRHRGADLGARCSGPSPGLADGEGSRGRLWFAFEERGEYELKGVPGTWRLYAVADG